MLILGNHKNKQKSPAIVLILLIIKYLKYSYQSLRENHTAFWNIQVYLKNVKLRTSHNKQRYLNWLINIHNNYLLTIRILLATIAAIAISLSSNVFGQTSQGSLYVRGGSNMNMGFSKIKYDGVEATNLNFNFSPSVRYFVIDNLALGIGFPLSFNKIYREDGNESSTNSIRITPSAVYFFGESNFKPFIGAEFGYQKAYSKFTSGNGLNTNDYENISFRLDAGVAYFITERIGLDMGLYYDYNKQNELNYKQSGMIIDVGFNIKLN